MRSIWILSFNGKNSGVFDSIDTFLAWVGNVEGAATKAYVQEQFSQTNDASFYLFSFDRNKHLYYQLENSRVITSSNIG